MRLFNKGFGLIAAVAALVSTAALADFPVKQADGTTISVGSLVLSGVHFPKNALIDATGAQTGITGNPLVTALPTGAATATNQAANTTAITNAQAAAGSSASVATGVQGVAGGVLVGTTNYLPQLTSTAGLATSFGTTAATLFNANTSRHYITVQVQGAVDNTGTVGCWINGIGSATADANSLYVPRGGYFESSTHVGTGAIGIVCSAASTAVYSRQG